MPALIADLLRGKPDLVTASIGTLVKDVLAEMIKYDYSQLPVIDEKEKPIGLVTSDSIVRALHNFGVKTDALCVKDAMLKKPATYYTSDDVFDLLDDLETDEVVLVIDEVGKLIGIITTYDTTAYLRQRAQDIMVVQEIEEMVKSYTSAAFTTSSGDIDVVKQKAAIAEITPSNSSQKGKFRRALQQYLAQRGETNPAIDQGLLDAAFDAHLYEKPSIKPFDKLSLGEYINVFLHQNRWKIYSTVFTIDREAIRRLLNAVRQTRNALAHFRDDITPQQREELRFCKEWLARHEQAINRAFGAVNGVAVSSQQTNGQGNGEIPAPTHGSATPTSQGDTTASSANGDEESTVTPITDPVSHETKSESISAQSETVPSTVDEAVLEPLDEPPSSLGGRYAPLVRYLMDQPSKLEKLTLSFDEIDKLLGEHQLPESARKYRAWWANDSVSHSHSQQWLEAGWRVANINMADERVVFARTSDHEQSYLQFFAALQQELERAAPGSFRLSSSGGRYWLTLDYVRADNKTVASFYCAFTRTKRLRVELYLDTYDQLTTKQLFNALLSRKELIEAEVGEKLSWEKLEDKRGSRIARYYPGRITDTAGALANLRARAVEAATRFVPVLRRHVIEVIPAVLGQAVAEAAPEKTP
jgi:CBS domain-containing protein